jgi:hypothetical protein
VAPGESLLTYHNGAEIDSHDLVIRVGGGGGAGGDPHQPTAGFQRHVGSRTDVYVATDAREGRKFAKSNPKLKFCKCKSPQPRVMPAAQPHPAVIVWSTEPMLLRSSSNLEPQHVKGDEHANKKAVGVRDTCSRANVCVWSFTCSLSRRHVGSMFDEDRNTKPRETAGRPYSTHTRGRTERGTGEQTSASSPAPGLRYRPSYWRTRRWTTNPCDCGRRGCPRIRSWMPGP